MLLKTIVMVSKSTFLAVILGFLMNVAWADMPYGEREGSDAYGSEKSEEFTTSFIDYFIPQVRDANDDAQTVVDITSSVLQSLSEDVEDEAWNDLLDRLERIKVFNDEQHNGLFTKASTQLEANRDYNYGELMEVRTDQKEFLLLKQEGGNHIEEILMIFQQGPNGGLVSLQGQLQESDLKHFREGIDLQRLTEME